MRQARRWLAACLATGAVFTISAVIFQFALRWLIKDSDVRWGVAGAGATAVASVVVAWGAGSAANEHAPDPAENAKPSPGRLPRGIQERPEKVTEVVNALARSRQPVVGLHGAGGYGKTTLARMVENDDRVIQRYPGGVEFLAIGPDAHGPALAGAINDLIKKVDGGSSRRDPTFTDPKTAGRDLGSLLSKGAPRLLILDDVWAPEQLAGCAFA